jgi:hypothetical protein
MKNSNEIEVFLTVAWRFVIIIGGFSLKSFLLKFRNNFEIPSVSKFETCIKI